MLIIGGRWWDAGHAPGSLAFLRGEGGVPAAVPEHVITELRSRERGGYVRLPRPRGLQKGDPVFIRRGALEGLRGLYAGQSGAQRVHVLLQLLNGQRRVVLPAADVVAI